MTLVHQTHRTGIKIVRSSYTGNNKTKKTKTETTTFEDLAFIEPFPRKYRKELIDAYGEQSGNFYLLHLETSADAKNNDTVYFNKSGLYQNTAYSSSTDDIKLKVINIDIGGGDILPHQELTLVTYN